ncbi:MerR family transcriptional regulator [Nocardia iowensis]|uniref:MerR family transcriptional regulator n=1 Tax=Nocardia iowensis TaxID=204891 RepID=A0ABX8RYB2_NOCIO|nr:MerR family transcriptional regulator [Nocardia iowensis]QXN94643.1 MerR family transcriptional regulator [Nocardia iowensis]
MAGDAEYTIDELARVAETTVRSVRVYHERGLLPSPEVRGRIGYYGADHLHRLQTISRLLSRGMQLNGIRELLDAWDRGDGLATVLGVPEPEPPVPVEVANAPTPAAEPVVPAPASFPATSRPIDWSTTPRCADLAARLVDTGLAAEDARRLLERLRADCDRIADEYSSPLFWSLARQAYERSDRAPEAEARLETDLAIARLIVTRAAAELIDQAFGRYAEPTA